jgi:L-ribulose-5-phosphate 3-epimerase
MPEFRELAAEAERAGIRIDFENTSSGEDNRYAVDKMNSMAFKVWYDVGNSTFNGYDVPREIRLLGEDCICMFHFKHKGSLGEGQVNFPAILRAIDGIGFEVMPILKLLRPRAMWKAIRSVSLEYLRKLMEA